MFIQKVQEQLLKKVGLDCEEDIWQKGFSFRLFAASSGNISELMNKIIKPVASEVIRSERTLITNDDFVKAARRHLGFLDEQNPFILDIKDISAIQQNSQSYWNSNAPRGKNCVVDSTEKKVTFTDLKIKDIF